MTKIKGVKAMEILDSRGNWTVETEIELEGGIKGKAGVPAGASVGAFEMKTAPVKTCLAAINGVIATRLSGESFASQKLFDDFLINFDSSPDRGSLGSNTLLSLSLAFCQALSRQVGLPLYRLIRSLGFSEKSDWPFPQPLFNVINGGKHAHNDLDFQEFLLIPKESTGFKSNLRMAVLVYEALKSLLETNGFETGLGDEGGFAPRHLTTEGALNFIKEACALSQAKLGAEVFLGLDAAASSFTIGDVYQIRQLDKKITAGELNAYYLNLCQHFPLIYLEDPFDQNSWAQFTNLNRSFAGKIYVCGDDLVATNLERLKKAIKEKAINAVIVKPNQIGTVSETLEVIKEAQRNKIAVAVSHRSGETDDTFIADLAVAVGAEFIKAGAPARGERVAKYNRLLEIESELANGK